MKEEKPILIYQKNADKVLNRILIPKKFIEKWGSKFSMEVYEDKLIIKPIQRKEK